MQHFMTFSWKPLLLIFFLFQACDTGKLDLVASLNNSLDESSGLEVIAGSKLFYTIQDSGNSNRLYAVDDKGNIAHEYVIANSKNEDWEDLTTDKKGNIYIGDFGNNSRKRKKFAIYKVNLHEMKNTELQADKISFKLPEKAKSKDFESFLLYREHFYIFSKEKGSCIVISVPNTIGDHEAKLVETLNLKGKDNKITSADISSDGATIVLLNHDKLWKITDFKSDHFLEGTIEKVLFNHNSQKEGVCFWDNETIFISDERKGPHGGNIYKLKLSE